jgi:hypothetical protein
MRASSSEIPQAPICTQLSYSLSISVFSQVISISQMVFMENLFLRQIEGEDGVERKMEN